MFVLIVVIKTIDADTLSFTLQIVCLEWNSLFAIELLRNVRRISSVIRQKGKSQNGCFKKIKHVKFSKKRTFLTPWCAQVRTTRFFSLHGYYAFPLMLIVGGASWTFDSSMKAMNCKIKVANRKLIVVNILAYNNFMWTKQGVIIDVEIWIIETYSLFNSNLAVRICTVRYVEYLAECFVQN